MSKNHPSSRPAGTARIEVLPSLRAATAEIQLLVESDSAWDLVPMSQVKAVKGLLKRLEFSARHLRSTRLADDSALD